MVVRLAVYSLQRVVILVLIISVKSVFISLIMWSLSSLAIIKVLDVMAGALVWGLQLPCWVHFRFDLVRVGYFHWC